MGEGEYKACRSAQQLDSDMIARWQLGVAMPLRSVIFLVDRSLT